MTIGGLMFRPFLGGISKNARPLPMNGTERSSPRTLKYLWTYSLTTSLLMNCIASPFDRLSYRLHGFNNQHRPASASRQLRLRPWSVLWSETADNLVQCALECFSSVSSGWANSSGVHEERKPLRYSWHSQKLKQQGLPKFFLSRWLP